MRVTCARFVSCRAESQVKVEGRIVTFKQKVVAEHRHFLVRIKGSHFGDGLLKSWLVLQVFKFH